MAPKRSTRVRVDPKRAVAYLRVSTDRETQALGIAAQRAALESWAARDGVEIVAWYTEEVSGGASLEKRPVLLEAIAALNEHKAGLLVVQRLDRFSRDPLTAAMAEIEASKFGARVVTADGVGNGDDPSSRLMRDLGLAVGRFERQMIAARTKAALAVKKARGETTGTPPYGWAVAADEKTLVVDDKEQGVRQRLRALRAKGWSYRALCKEATLLGFASRTGKPFTLQAIFSMVQDATPEGIAPKFSRRVHGPPTGRNPSPRMGGLPSSGIVGVSKTTPTTTRLSTSGIMPFGPRLGSFREY